MADALAPNAIKTVEKPSTKITLSAASLSVADGVALLSIYSLGLGVPFLAVALFTGSFVARLKSIGKVGARLQVIAAAARWRRRPPTAR